MAVNQRTQQVPRGGGSLALERHASPGRQPQVGRGGRNSLGLLLMLLLLLLVTTSGSYLFYTKLSEYEESLDALAEQLRTERVTQQERIREARQARREMDQQAEEPQPPQPSPQGDLSVRGEDGAVPRFRVRQLVERHYALQESTGILNGVEPREHEPSSDASDAPPPGTAALVSP